MVDMRQATSPGTAGHSFDRDSTDFGGVRSGDNLLDFPQPARASAEDLLVLQRVVAFEILPRVIRAHGADPAQALPRLPAEERVSDEVKAFCNIVLSQNADAALRHIEALVASGRSLETIYLDLMVPCARYLRRLWDEDVCDFAAATLALWRLQQLLRDFSTAFRSLGAEHSCGLRALLVPAPGEKQELSFIMFDLALIGEFFPPRRLGCLDRAGFIERRIFRAGTHPLVRRGRIPGEWRQAARCARRQHQRRAARFSEPGAQGSGLRSRFRSPSRTHFGCRWRSARNRPETWSCAGP